MFSLAIFQESQNYNRDCRCVGVVMLTYGGIYRWISKVKMSGVVTLGRWYVPFSTSGTLGPLPHFLRSRYSLVSSRRGQEPSVWWNFLVFPLWLFFQWYLLIYFFYSYIIEGTCDKWGATFSYFFFNKFILRAKEHASSQNLIFHTILVAGPFPAP